ncbi:hypothetical protein ACH5RR_029604 [Cinchona calisaya]|uniref:Methylenetetrahydrofolate reductase n=1 Tax=Cinchona calisaya TaxID=153742 RepID=A0ABD2YTB9_9GENT
MGAKYGDYFGITIAGYPEAHPDVIPANRIAPVEAYHFNLVYLKRKGLCLSTIPRASFMTGFCKPKIPPEIMAALEPIKDNEEAVRNYGIHLGTEMCKKILANGIKTLHLYTLNMEKSALFILMNLGIIEESKISRPLPRRHPTNIYRIKEDVRPIFWANHPKSYISRTIGWEQYPHGRWGDSQNASYGALSDYQACGSQYSFLFSYSFSFVSHAKHISSSPSFVYLGFNICRF